METLEDIQCCELDAVCIDANKLIAGDGIWKELNRIRARDAARLRAADKLRKGFVVHHFIYFADNDDPRWEDYITVMPEKWHKHFHKKWFKNHPEQPGACMRIIGGKYGNPNISL